MIANKNLNAMSTELFVRGRKLNISVIFYYAIILYSSKNIRLNSMSFNKL